ncbi:MAG: zinc ribbon domain-containing protein [Clostridiales bacterium]|nr:zinc ribbon domain-containing protein [Clostridiales bacterium]
MAQVKCPDCGKVVNPEEGFCMYCGYNFDGSEEVQTKTFAPAYNPVIGARKTVPEPAAAQAAETQHVETQSVETLPVETQTAATPSPFAKSPFAQNTDAQAGFGGDSFDDLSSDEPAGSNGSPVIRFDSNSYADSMPAYAYSGSSGKGDLMFGGIGMCRILAIFFAGLVIIAMLLPFVTARVEINKTMIPANTDTSSLVRMAAEKKMDYKDDGMYISISKSASLIQSPNYYLYLMIGACVVGIVFAVKGKPAVYLVCGIGGALLAAFNYIMNFSSIDAIMKSNAYTKLMKAGSQYGISIYVDKGPGAVLMLIGGIGMIVAAIIFVNNHAAYDD